MRQWIITIDFISDTVLEKYGNDDDDNDDFDDDNNMIKVYLESLQLMPKEDETFKHGKGDLIEVGRVKRLLHNRNVYIYDTRKIHS